MKLALGLLIWFVSENVRLVVGITVFVAVVVLLTAIWTPQP